jgi:hypothetical protein
MAHLKKVVIMASLNRHLFPGRPAKRWVSPLVLNLALLILFAGLVSGQSSTPVISSVSPNRIAVGSASTQVDVVGTGFASGMVVRLNNSESLITSFISTNELQALIPEHISGKPESPATHCN